MDEEKICKTCNKLKVLGEFKSNGVTKSGNKKYKPHCLICFRGIDRENRLKRIESSDPEHGERIKIYRDKIHGRGEKPDGHNWCYVCENYKVTCEFSTNGLKNYKCRGCSSEYDIQRARKLKLDGIKYLGGTCNKCGFIGHYASFDFHHRNPKEKSFNWNTARKKSWSKIVIELDKCQLLCSNCHRIVHCKLNNDGGKNKLYCQSND